MSIGLSLRNSNPELFRYGAFQAFRQSERLYSDFFSGTYAESIDKGFQVDELPGAIKIVPICLAIWVDGSCINSSMTRKVVPIYMFVLNNLKLVPHMLGYVPSELPYNVQEIVTMLNKAGVRAASHQEHVIRLAKRMSVRRFVLQLLKPIFDVQDKSQDEFSITCQIGKGVLKRLIRARFVLTTILLDNVEAPDFSGINSKRCRCCNEKNLGNIYYRESEMAAERDIEDHIDSSSLYESNEEKRILKIALKNLGLRSKVTKSSVKRKINSKNNTEQERITSKINDKIAKESKKKLNQKIATDGLLAGSNDLIEECTILHILPGEYLNSIS